MVDFHTHVLPCVDDGSKSVEESVKMVQALAQQGVKLVAATPHFYADHQSVDSFLSRRAEAYEMLTASLPENSPGIVLGAEVSYYEGISRLVGLERLRFEGGRALLLEMPCARWHDSCVRELLQISSRPDLRLVIAHGERYLHLQSNSVINALLENDVYIQTNASTLSRLFERGKAIKLLRSGVYHLLGSDCHNLTSRPPSIGDAYALVEKKLGISFVNVMHELAYSLIDG